MTRASSSPFGRLLARILPNEGGIEVSVGDGWTQGRTLYGGLSAALCVEAARRVFEGLPPLRSAQFAFVGPASGVVSVKPEVLRRGKSTAFVSADLHGDAGLATRALLCFATARASSLSHAAMPAPAVPAVADCPAFFTEDAGPAFFRQFDTRRAGGAVPCSAATPEFLLWIRHADGYPAGDATALIALADVAPPAAMAMFTASAPISTMTWSVEMLAEPDTDPPGGWLLLRSTAQTVSAGYSTQIMQVWDEAGRAVMSASQCVAVFA